MNSSNLAAGPAAELLAVLPLGMHERARCHAEGCRRPARGSVHVVHERGRLLVLDTDCFQQRYGGASALGAPALSTPGGRLSAEVRQALVDQIAVINTARENLQPADEMGERRRPELRLVHSAWSNKRHT